MTDPDRLLVGALLIEDEPVHGREEGQTPFSWPVSDQIKPHTCTCGFAVAFSCVLLSQPGSCLSLLPHMPFPWLQSLAGCPFLWEEPLAPSILPISRKMAEHLPAPLLPVWDYPSSLLILRASPLAVSWSQYFPLPWRM